MLKTTLLVFISINAFYNVISYDNKKLDNISIILLLKMAKVC